TLKSSEEKIMASKKYVVLADIESVRAPYTTFAAALEELSQLGEIAACKFYGYSAKRTKDYGEFIQENSYDALSALPKKRKGKLDLRQVIDAARLAQFPNIDGFFIIYGNGDITPLIAYLKAYGKDVVAGVIEDDKNSKLCNKVIYLKADEATTETVLNDGYIKVEPSEEVEEPKKPEPKKAEPAPAPAQPAPAKEESIEDDPQMAVLLKEFQKILNG
ncbi:MAG: NYN domain-containing protein, partial [Clostridia bacterium]|nr:NYN domain-containing protein [Clostridia bacterium]